MSDHPDTVSFEVARMRSAAVSARIRPALTAFDAARSPAWRSCLPPPHGSPPWHPCDSRTLMHLPASGRLGRYFDVVPAPAEEGS